MSTKNNEELMNSTKRPRKKRKKKKSKIKGILLFLLFEIIFTGITFPLYIFYGPFEDVRDLLVGISMSSGNYQFVAKTFLSDEEINKILNNETKKANEESEDLSLLSQIKYSENDEEMMLKDVSSEKFDGKALIIKDPTRVKVGYSSKIGVVGESVSSMADRYGAIAAINGGGYRDVNAGYSGGTGGIPLGILVSDGKVLYPENEKEYNKKEMVFSLDSQGKMFVGQASVNDLLEKDCKQAISFGPSLIVNGEPEISETTVTGLNPRTAIGQTEDGRIIFLVIDGRQGLKWGASLQDVQKVMIQLGAVNAMALDGGGSTAMYYNGEIINNPSNLTGERSVPDIVYVK